MGNLRFESPGSKNVFDPRQEQNLFPQHIRVSRAAELQNICDHDKVSITMFPSRFSEVFNNTKNTVSTVHSLQFTAVRCLWISGLPSLVFNLNMSFSLFMLARFIESQQRLTRDLRMINGKFRRRIRPVTVVPHFCLPCANDKIFGISVCFFSSMWFYDQRMLEVGD